MQNAFIKKATENPDAANSKLLLLELAEYWAPNTIAFNFFIWHCTKMISYNNNKQIILNKTIFLKSVIST